MFLLIFLPLSHYFLFNYYLSRDNDGYYCYRFYIPHKEYSSRSYFYLIRYSLMVLEPNILPLLETMSCGSKMILPSSTTSGICLWSGGFYPRLYMIHGIHDGPNGYLVIWAHKPLHWPFWLIRNVHQILGPTYSSLISLEIICFMAEISQILSHRFQILSSNNIYILVVSSD